MIQAIQTTSQTGYWRRNLLWIAGLSGVWCLVAFVPAYFALELNDFFIFGWPFAFWMGAFGAPLFFLLIVGVYAWCMGRTDRDLRAAKKEVE